MKISFDSRALSELEDIYRWISLDSRAAAKSVDQRIRDSIRQLAFFPLSGRVGVKGARELVVAKLPYIVVYDVQVEAQMIIIRQIVHMARDRER